MANRHKTFTDLFKSKVEEENLTLTQQFKLLQLRKKELEAKQAEVADLIYTCEEAIFAEWEAEGVATVKLDTGETVYTHSQYWAKAAPKLDKKGNPITDKDGNELYYSKEDIIKALRASGFGDLISEGYNSNSLSGVIRELKKNKEDIPEPLAKVITAEPTYSVRIRGLKAITETLLEEDEIPY